MKIGPLKTLTEGARNQYLCTLLRGKSLLEFENSMHSYCKHEYYKSESNSIGFRCVFFTINYVYLKKTCNIPWNAKAT